GRGAQREAAGVTEGVEDAPAARQLAGLDSVVALVEIEAGLLPLGEVDAEAQATFLDDDGRRRRAAAEGTVVQFQTLKLTDAALRAELSAGRLQQLLKQICEQVAGLGESQRGELHDQPAVVTINDKAGQTIALAEDEPASAAGRHQAERLAQTD